MKNFRVKVDSQCCHGQTHYPAATLLTQCDFSSCSLLLDTCQQLLFFKSHLACVTMAVTQGEKSFKYTSTGWLWLRCVMLTPNRTWWCVWLPQNKYKIKICKYLLCFTFMCWLQIDFFQILMFCFFCHFVWQKRDKLIFRLRTRNQLVSNSGREAESDLNREMSECSGLYRKTAYGLGSGIETAGFILIHGLTSKLTCLGFLGSVE